jgi:hypothetical protein
MIYTYTTIYIHIHGLPADFLDWLGYQLIFFIRWDRPFLPVGLPADFLDWLGYQLIFIIIFFS